MDNSKKGSNVISFLIALIIVCILFYFIYIKFIRINTPDMNNNNFDNTIIDDKDIEKIGKEKYNWLSSQKSVDGNSFVFFKDKSVYLNTIDFQDVLTNAYNLADSVDKNKTNCNDDNCIIENFSKNVLKEQVDKNFSSKLNLVYKDFRPTGSILCTIDNETYNCKKDMIELKIDPLFILPGYLYSRIYNGKLIVYSTFISVKRKMDIYSENEQGIYGGTNLKNKIDDLSTYNQYENNLTKENIQIIIDKYKDKLPVYKSTFILENNNYVWEKTEIEK